MPLQTEGSRKGPPQPEQASALPGLSHPDHIWLYDYWLARKPPGGLTNRRDIDPTDFPKLLPRMAIVAAEATKDGQRYRYRLAGTEIASRAGRDPTGKTFEELYEGDYLARAQALYDGLCSSAEPHFSRQNFPIGEGEGFLRYDRLILPLACENLEVGQFLLLIVVIKQSGGFHRQGSFPRAGTSTLL